MTNLVWYVAYGSNMAGDRLRAYLEGGDDRFGAHRGCTDPTPPHADRVLTLDRAVTFRGRSQRWSGGVAFLDLDPTPGTATPARAWLLGVDQIADLAAQEGRLVVAPAPEALTAIPPGGTLAIGGGWYDTILRLPDVDGRPALTITTAQDLPEADPAPAYLAAVEAGRDEVRAQGAVRARGGGPTGPPSR